MPINMGKNHFPEHGNNVARAGSPLAMRVLFYGMLWLGVIFGLMFFASLAGVAYSRQDIFGIRAPQDVAQESPDEENAPYAPIILPAGNDAAISIKTLGISSPIIFPQSTDYPTLRAALNQGVTHYPFSALPDAPNGNVFLFGHSSAHAYEANPARTVFTRLNQLKPGDVVEVGYKGILYAYRVSSVRISPPDEATVYFATPQRMLTLSTCWPIGDPKNRFIVQAEFVRQFSLSGNQVSVGTL